MLTITQLIQYEQSEQFRAELERSKGLYIVENQTSFPRKTADTWGAKLSKDGVTWSGSNLMGRLLMQLRDEGKLDYTLLDGIISFGDLL